MKKIWFFRCSSLTVLALAAYWVVRLAWANHLGGSDNLADREQAVRLAPQSASLWERLADKREEAGGDPLPDLVHATRLDPVNARRFERLGQRAELAGQFTLAETSLLRAAEMSRLYQPRYRLAQYYFRRQNLGQWKRWTGEALATSYGDVTPLLELMWRADPDGSRFAQRGAAERPAVARQFLSFLLPAERVAAAPLARHIAETGGASDLPILFRYCDEALVQRDVPAALEVWNIVCQRKLLPHSPLDPLHGVSLTNGNFVHHPAGAGFDWHVEPAPGIQVAPLSNNVRITFSGNQSDHALITWQYVPLVRGASYRLQFDGQTEGLGWSLYSPAAGAWLEMSPSPAGEFRAPSDLVRLALVYRRNPGSVRLAAELLVSSVRLELQP